MATATLKKPTKHPLDHLENVAELLEMVGNVPPDRVRWNPFPGTATEQDVIRFLEADDKHLCELIDGVLVEKAMGFKESFLASILSHYIWAYLEGNDLGIAFSPDGPVRVSSTRIRFPDTGFISWKRLPNEEFPEEKILNVMPELAVEVLSESNTKQEMELKLDDYFRAGVKLVWYIDPEAETVTVCTGRHTKKLLTKEDTLDGGKVLPGFSLPIKKLFSRVHRRRKKR